MRAPPPARRALAGLLLAAAACTGTPKMVRVLEDGRLGDDSFKVAVVHMKGEIRERETRAQVDALTRANWGRVEPLVRRAAGAGAKVVVTPEYGITGGGIGRSEQRATSTTLPPVPTREPLHAMEADGVIWYLVESSRLADELDVYLVVQALERGESEGEECYYNTLMAFDPDGRLVARYRKINLYLTEMMTTTGGDETASFDTPWGRFGMLLCFDAVVPWTVRNCINDHDVDFFVVSSRWQPYLPLPGNTAMNFLATITGRPVLWSNHNSAWGTGGGAGVIRPGPLNDTDLGMLEQPGVIVANLRVPERVLVARTGR